MVAGVATSPEATPATEGVPFAPLTLSELNYRCAGMQADISWTAWSAFKDESKPPTEVEERRLRQLVIQMNELHEAAMVRLGESPR